MNKAELIARIAEKLALPKAQVESVFNETFNAISTILSEQNKINIPGFGGFSAKKRGARKGRNPSTGTEIIIPEKIVASFQPSSTLKQLINA